MKTGFKDLDACISGFNNGELIILGGRPGIGKTSLAVDISRNSGKAVYLDLEPSSRLIEQACDYGFTLISDRDMDNPNGERENGMHSFCRREIANDDTFDLVIVDDIQLLNAKRSLRKLKGLAQKINKPIFALSQLNRNPEQRRETRQPKIYDFKSVSSNQLTYADKILLLYRNDYYVPYELYNNTATIIICKGAIGSQNEVLLHYIGRKDGLGYFDYTPDYRMMPREYENSDSFESDLKYAKSLTEITDRADCINTVSELRRLHERYYEHQDGRIYAVYIGDYVIAREYAKGLYNLFNIRFRDNNVRNESVSQMETLHSIYRDDVLISQLFASVIERKSSFEAMGD